MRALCLVEHKDRELDVLCLVRALARQRHGIDIEIANVSADAPLLLRKEPPRIVFFSSFYSAEWKLRKEYTTAWHRSKICSLSWEQIFCPIDQHMHKPLDEYAKTSVHYLSWYTGYQDYLVSHGVLPENISLVGHALYDLYQKPFSGYFPDRDSLAARHGLDTGKRWVFIPENYGFAFLSDAAVTAIARRHSMTREAEEKLASARAYCRASLSELLKWTNALALACPDLEMIFRPRPSLDSHMLGQFLQENGTFGKPAFHIIREETAREWVLASDLVISSFSTVLIEAALAGKAIRKVEPFPLPEQLQYEWTDKVASIRTQAELMESVVPGSGDGGSAALRVWARENFAPNGDSVTGLVDEIARLTGAAYSEVAPYPRARITQRTPRWLRLADRVMPPRTRHAFYARYVNEYTHKVLNHERDFFSQGEVRRRTRRWEKVLNA